MLKRLFALLVFSLCAGTAAAASDVIVVYLGTDDCPYCRHWEARAKRELLAFTEGKGVRYYEVKGETLRQPIVERHFPEELKWLARRIGPSRGVPRFLLVVDGQLTRSVYGTNDYETVFLPALRAALLRVQERA